MIACIVVRSPVVIVRLIKTSLPAKKTISNRARILFNRVIGDVMADLQLLEACWRGELRTVQELVKRKDPNSAIEKRHRHEVRVGGKVWYTDGFRPLHYACL